MQAVYGEYARRKDWGAKTHLGSYARRGAGAMAKAKAKEAMKQVDIYIRTCDKKNTQCAYPARI